MRAPEKISAVVREKNNKARTEQKKKRRVRDVARDRPRGRPAVLRKIVTSKDTSILLLIQA